MVALTGEVPSSADLKEARPRLDRCLKEGKVTTADCKGQAKLQASVARAQRAGRPRIHGIGPSQVIVWISAFILSA
jgi:hypothetical protein